MGVGSNWYPAGGHGPTKFERITMAISLCIFGLLILAGFVAGLAELARHL